MSKTYVTGARGWFLAGAILLVLTGAGHALVIVARPVREGAEADVFARMAALEGEVLGMMPSILDAFLTLDLYFPILAVMAGVQALLVWRAAGAAPGLLRPHAVVGALGAGLAAAVALAHEIPPPAAFFALVAACFGVSALRARGAGGYPTG
jgi:hypothetical protein